MKLLIVHPRLSVMGGGERVAIHSIKEALKEGHEVYIATEQFDRESFEDFFGVQGILDNVRILSYRPFRPLIHKGLLYQRLAYNQAQLRRILSTSPSFDLVLNTAEVANQPATKAPSVQYCYFPEYFSHLDTNSALTIWEIYYWPVTVFYQSRVNTINRLLSVSDFTKGVVRKIWHRESTTLYPPCPIENYRNPGRAKEDLVVTIGRVSPEKRMELFCEMARRLPTMKFAIIGSVAPDRISYYEKLRAMTPANLSFVMSPLRKVADMLSRAKVYVHCAKNEHFGITIVESMAAGCVPVVHDSGGPREIVSEEVGFRWNSMDQAVAEVDALIENEGVRRRLAASAASRAEAFSPGRFQAGMGEVFRSFSGGV